VTTSTRPPLPSYSFDNDDPEAIDRHNYLPLILDELTTTRLSSVGDLTGRRCLEIGAGGGSIAAWLADQVGPTGRVLATDLNLRHIPPDPGYQVLRHDLVNEPVPEGPWDVIHVRLVLLHIPQRREILGRLAAALAPGGALVVEDFDTTFRKMVLAAPDAETAALVDLYHSTLVERVLPAKGNDPSWASRVHAHMLDEGLVDVHTVIDSRSWPGGTPGALLLAANVAQLRAEFLAAGVTGEQLDRFSRAMSDPGLVVRGSFTYSTIGRRPTT
jgi:SAM-dependent methyltransferase